MDLNMDEKDSADAMWEEGQNQAASLHHQSW